MKDKVPPGRQTRNWCETIPAMTTDDRKGDRHKHTPRSWRPDPETLPAAQEAAKEVMGSLNGYLRASVEYLLGIRKDPPPRPEWAEERAAALPDDGAIRSPEATDT